MAIDYMDRFLGKRCTGGAQFLLLSTSCLFVATQQERSMWPIKLHRTSSWTSNDLINVLDFVPIACKFVSIFASKFKLLMKLEYATTFEFVFIEVQTIHNCNFSNSTCTIPPAFTVMDKRIWLQFWRPYVALLQLVKCAKCFFVTSIQKEYLEDVFQIFCDNMTTSCHNHVPRVQETSAPGISDVDHSHALDEHLVNMTYLLRRVR